MGCDGLDVRITIPERHDLEAGRLLHRIRQGRSGSQDIKIGEVGGGAGGIRGALPALKQTGDLRCARDETRGGIEGEPRRQGAGGIGSRIKAGGEIGSGHLLVHGPAFAACDNPVGGDDRQRQRAVRRRAVKGNGGVSQCADVTDDLVDDLQLPVAHGAFAPAMRGHEGPVEIGPVVVEARAGQTHRDAAGGDEAPLQVAAIRVRGFDVHGDVFQPKIV